MTTTAEIARTDPDFARIEARFAAEVRAHGSMDDRERALCVLSALIALGETDEFALQLDEALNGALSPAQVRELVYQSAAYLGFARARVFLAAANGVFAARGVSLPREQEAPDAADRLEAGARVQAALFGEETADFWQYGPEETRHLGRMMVENCFGDFYSRGILSLKDRELAAFCTLAALGGGAQLKVRVVAGYAAGNDRAVLISALTQLVPVIGWTRVLNALAILTETDKELNDDGYDDDPY